MKMLSVHRKLSAFERYTDVSKNYHIWQWKGRFRHPSVFAVATFEVCIRGIQNFVGFFKKIFRQALCQSFPAGGGGRNFLECPIRSVRIERLDCIH